MNYPSIKLGKLAIEDDEYFKNTVSKIINTRERVKKELSDLGFSGTESMSNFLFVTHKNIMAKDIFGALKEKHIFVRYFDKPRIDNYLRITIGTDDEMDKLIAFLKEYINK